MPKEAMTNIQELSVAQFREFQKWATDKKDKPHTKGVVTTPLEHKETLRKLFQGCIHCDHHDTAKSRIIEGDACSVQVCVKVRVFCKVRAGHRTVHSGADHQTCSMLEHVARKKLSRDHNGQPSLKLKTQKT